jgi:hypothetical protein
MSADCVAVTTAQQEMLLGYLMVRWPGTANAGCPMTWQDLMATDWVEDFWSVSLPAYPGCVPLETDGPISFTDLGLESGETYTYRIWPMFSAACNGEPNCFEERVYPPAEVSATTRLIPPTRGRPALAVIPPPLELRVTEIGPKTCYWFDCEVSHVSFAWTPWSGAASYVVAIMVRREDGTEYFLYRYYEPQVIAASAPPTFRSAAIETGVTVRACIAIVDDPAWLPNPMAGRDCVEFPIP